MTGSAVNVTGVPKQTVLLGEAVIETLALMAKLAFTVAGPVKLRDAEGFKPLKAPLKPVKL